MVHGDCLSSSSSSSPVFIILKELINRQFWSFPMRCTGSVDIACSGGTLSRPRGLGCLACADWFLVCCRCRKYNPGLICSRCLFPLGILQHAPHPLYIQSWATCNKHLQTAKDGTCLQPQIGTHPICLAHVLPHWVNQSDNLEFLIQQYRTPKPKSLQVCNWMSKINNLRFQNQLTFGGHLLVGCAYGSFKEMTCPSPISISSNINIFSLVQHPQ